MAAEQSMIQAVTEAVIEATKADIIAIREADNPVKMQDQYKQHPDQAVQCQNNLHLNGILETNIKNYATLKYS